MLLEELNIPTKKIKQLNNEKIFSIEDLLAFLPRKYYDFRNPDSLENIKDNELGCFIGKIKTIKSSSKMVKAVMIEEKSGKIFNVIWLNQAYMEKKLNEEYLKKKVICAGKVKINAAYQSIDILNPIFFSTNIEYNQRIMPVYKKVKNMSTEYFQNIIDAAISIADKKDNLSPETLKRFNIVSKREMIDGIHNPKTPEEITRAKKRLLFDDLYYFAVEMKNQKQNKAESTVKIQNMDMLEKFYGMLPYELTKDQNNAITEILSKIREGKQTSSLINGDVGCGKTTIAFALMIAIASNGYQAALMAPTGVLAKQHYNELNEYAEKLGLKTVYLSSELTAKNKREALSGIKNGEYSFIVGTQSAIADAVIYNKLGITIVDEEHRFGVMQKEQINKKAEEGVHSVIMSATPIPRTQALALYGENIDVYNIETMPNGREPVQTAIASNDITIYNFMEKQINLGHQCFMVCPLISENESDDEDDKEPIESVELVYEKTASHFKNNPNIKIGIVTGKMKKKEMDEEMQKFANNEYNILISTTVVEVGVNVPNSTLIVVTNAERFGLTTLHQLRGRVGRGKYKSYCILKSKFKDNPRLVAMTETTNGFKIAEKDLQLRGSGDFIGTAQSGNNKYVMLMIAFPKLYASIKQYIKSDE